jgi:TonB family protein
MNETLKYLIEASIVISVFYLIYVFVYKGDKNSKFNRIYLISSSFLAVILPVLRFPIISGREIEYTNSLHHAIQLPEIIISDQYAANATQSEISLSQIIVIVYFTGLAFFLFRFLYELFLTFKHIRTCSDNSEKSESYTLINTEGKLPTCSFYKYLFWDDTQNINEKESNFIIKHEEGHIRQRHTFDLIYLEILRIIFWFNPIFHGYKKAMLSVHEYLADEFALANTNQQGFVALLGRQVLQKHNLTLSNHFSKSQTVKRIKMIKSEKKKPAVLRWTVMVAVILTMFYFFSCEQGYSLNELKIEAANLPDLGDGWNYVAIESLSTEMSEKVKVIKAENVSDNIYVAKATNGSIPLPDLSGPYMKHAYRIWFEKEDDSYFIIISEKEKEPDQEIATVDSENEVNGEKVFYVVENQPVPEGGLPGFYKFISENMKYPEEARKKGIQGKVFIQFVVEKDGSVSNVKCVRGIHPLCDDEAVRVISNSPGWEPGQQDGENVNVRLIVPITFKMNDSGEKKE